MKSKYLIKTLLIIVLYFALGTVAYSQSNAIDSLQKIINAGKKDTSEVIALTDLANLYIKTGKAEEGLKLCEQAIALGQKLKFNKGEALGNYYAAKGCIFISENEKGITYADRTIELTDKTDHDKVRASAFIIKGNILMRQGNYTKAMEALYNGLHTSEKLNDTIGMVNTRGVIGNVYSKLSETKKALEQYHFCRDMAVKGRYKNGLAAAYINLGNLFGQTNQYDSAIVYLKRALPLLIKKNDKFNLSVVYGSLAVNYNALNATDTARKYIMYTIQLTKEIGHTDGHIDSYLTLSEIFLKTKNYKAVKLYMDSVTVLLRENPSKVSEREMRNVLYMLYKQTGETAKALENYELYVKLNSELVNEENRKEVQRKEMEFEFEKKENEIKLRREKQDLLAEEEKKKQKYIMYTVSAGFIMVLILLVVIIRSLRINKKKNKIISEQKDIVEEKQKEIIDSIKYAKRIQMSLLASEKYFSKNIDRLKGDKK